MQEIFGGGVKKTTAKKTTDNASTDAPAEEETGLQAIGHIDLALYTGQFTRDESAGVDFLIVGDVNRNALQKYVNELEGQEGKSIRYAVMKLPEFQYRQAIKDRFAVSIEGSKKQILVDEHILLS